MQGKQEINNTLLLKIWHSFSPEQLQNVNGISGNNIIPLPNIQTEFLTKTIDPSTDRFKEIKSKLNYLDKLFEASKTTPTVFIYSGKGLSSKQRKMFKNLHNEAKKIGGQLFVIDGDNFLRDNKLIDRNLTIYARDRTRPRSNYVDHQRMIYVSNPELLLKELNKQYSLNTSSVKYFLYSDFDRNFKEDLKFIELEKDQRERFSLYKRKEDNKIRVNVEINIIAVPTCSREDSFRGSKISPLVTDTYKNFGKADYEKVVLMCKKNNEIGIPATLSGVIAVEFFLLSQLQNNLPQKYQDSICNAFRPIDNKRDYIEIPIINSEQEKIIDDLFDVYSLKSTIEYSKDYTLEKNIESLILKDHCKAHPKNKERFDTKNSKPATRAATDSNSVEEVKVHGSIQRK